MHANKEEIFYQLALTMIPGVGDIHAKSLLAYGGSAAAVFKMPKAKLVKVPGIGDFTADSILAKDYFEQVEAELKFIEQYKIKVLFQQDADYPRRLLDCPDSPVLLYYKGIADLNSQKILAVVGTRNATDYGKQFIQKLMEDLAPHDVLVVSGLAYGIDTLAHKYALENNLQTVGVVGHGLNKIYPAQNKNLAKQMTEQGGLLTEFPSFTDMLPANFPQRNKTVAALCDALLVVQSAAKGGAIITADIARGYRKDVFALPGNVFETSAQGCNRLIKKQEAVMIDSAADILKAMHWQTEKVKPKAQKQLFLDLNPMEKNIVDLLKANGSLDIDQMMKMLQATNAMYASTLLELEMNGVIVSLPGKRYKLT